MKQRVRARRAALLGLCLLLPTAAAAIDGLTLTIGRMEGAGWSARDIELRLLASAGGRLGGSVRIEGATLPPPLGEIGELVIRCDRVSISAGTYTCEDGTARSRDSLLDESSFPLHASFDITENRFSFSSGAVPWRGLEIRLQADGTADTWSSRIAVTGADAERLHAALRPFGLADAGLEFSAGTVDFTALIRGAAGGVRGIRANAGFRELVLANDSGTLATDALTMSVELTAEVGRNGSLVDYRLYLAADDGEAYLEPAYLNLEATPLRIRASGRLLPEDRLVRVASLELVHASVLSATGTAAFRYDETPVLEALDLEIGRAIFPGVYDTYLQGFLTGTPFAKLETAGEVTGSVRMADDDLASIDLCFGNIGFDDRDGRIALYGARGNVAWRRDSGRPPLESRLSWDGGFVYSIGFGAADAVWHSDADSATLQGTLRVPMADGALNVETFRARGLTGDTPNVTFDARLEPVSLARITSALGWPALRGKLSGELPLLSLSEGELAIGGDLTARVFDGTVRIADLRIEQPFGAARRTTADVELDNLDLGIVTDVFSFGRIEGRLDGSVRGLSMLKGRPIAFDASFYTPVNDDSRHRISRRALNNISEIAGAGTALLSSGFLGLFQEFRYDSLGINCILEGDVCRMSGVRPTNSGYYLVKGSGLPRIDVIGHSREVNWPRLVAQIAEALRSREVSTTPQSEEQK